MSKGYEAGLKPDEILEPDGLTLKEVLAVIDAYDKRMMQHFNLNTRILAWYSLMPHYDRGKLPPFEGFLNSREGSEEQSFQDLGERAEYIRNLYKKMGYLK